MADAANRSCLRLCVAKICQDVGFNSIQSTPLEVLTDLLQDYMSALAKTAYGYALHCGNTEPNINHLALAFKDMGISVDELKEYVRYVDSTAVFDCPKYPVSKESHLNILKPGSREVVTRPFHIHQHLPPMHPHLEDQDLAVKQESNAESTPESTSPSNSKPKSFKRPGDAINEGSSKRNRFVCEEEGRPLRELSSVMMTTSGFLSPAREGKLPEARTPLVRNELIVNQETNSNINNNSEQKEKKKKDKLSPEQKKIEKEAKIIEKESETIKDEEVVKQKRMNGGKETKKSKSAKNNSADGTSTPKAHKQGKTKNNLTNVLPVNSTSKSIKVKSPKSDKLNHTMLSKDANQLLVSHNQVPPEYKIASEPDKQKLNIIKKISKMKEDNFEDIEEKVPESINSLSQVDVTIESVIKREMVSVEAVPQEAEMKDDVVDIETVNSPNPYDNLISNCDLMSEKAPVTSTPLIMKCEKKKKKIKKSKKDLSFDGTVSIPKTMKVSPDTTNIHEALETAVPLVHVNLSQNEAIPLQTVPDKVPSPLPSPVVHDVVSKRENQVSSTVSSTSSLSISISTNRGDFLNVTPDGGKSEGSGFEAVVTKKKIHKKDKKDKLKKKKKDKLKNKEKSEKKKLKQGKKFKDKEKQRIKKEKKERRKEKEAEETKGDSSNAVPKITLKLGPASPTNCSDNNTRKIVIIPIVKKDEPRQEKAPSPELARFSPLVPNPKQKSSKSSSVVEEVKISSDSKNASDLIESDSLPPSVKLDKHGNKVWICPACGKRDDGSPMIGCDGCDAWYHWVCVGIQVPPDVNNWYCITCLNKQKQTESEKKKKSKKKALGKK